MHVFRDFLVAAVEESDIGVGLGDDFAIEFEDQAQHAVGRRVGGSHVEDHPVTDEVVDFGVITFGGLRRTADGVRSLDFGGGFTHAVAAGISSNEPFSARGL
jgi:hypothetical protein